MTRQLFRSFVAMAVGGSDHSGARRAHIWAGGQAPSHGSGPPLPAQPQGQQPAQTPVVPVPVVPFQFARGRDYSLPPRLGFHTC